jgi:hypothetical protein
MDTRIPTIYPLVRLISRYPTFIFSQKPGELSSPTLSRSRWAGAEHSGARAAKGACANLADIFLVSFFLFFFLKTKKQKILQKKKFEKE